MTEKYDVVVPDTSVIAEGALTETLKKTIHTEKILIHEAVLRELEHQANQGRETGNIGLEEIAELRKTHEVEVTGRGPRPMEIRHAKDGAIDAMIRDLAYETGAVLITADIVQAKTAQAMGVHTHLIRFDSEKPQDPLKEYFTKTTMSVHFKEGSSTIAKRGAPGKWEFVTLKHKPKGKEMQTLAKHIVEAAQRQSDGYIEIERPGSTIVQLGKYRIVIARPPFASCWEITAVRPVVHLGLSDYTFPEKFQKRLEEKADGILVSGSPGEGKSTFTQALGEFYANNGKIVKTVEAPRDLVLPDTITQYSATHGTPEEIRDVLLLNRPDYTIYDEIRNTQDFLLFADMRLSGVGMIGVVHATSPVDSIQRFIGRVELGMVPHIIDTVVFIKAGGIAKVYSLSMTVKTPSGMTEADLARPIVVVTDFYTEKPEYEIYTYGDQTTVVPVTEQPDAVSPVLRLAAQSVQEYFKQYSSKVEVEMNSESKATIYVPEQRIANIIGKGGSTIQEIEKELGLSLDIKSLSDKKGSSNSSPHRKGGGSVQWEAIVAKRNITIDLSPDMANQEIELFDGSKELTTVMASKKGQVKITLSSPIGHKVRKALEKDTLEIYG